MALAGFDESHLWQRFFFVQFLRPFIQTNSFLEITSEEIVTDICHNVCTRALTRGGQSNLISHLNYVIKTHSSRKETVR